MNPIKKYFLTRIHQEIPSQVFKKVKVKEIKKYTVTEIMNVIG